MIHGCSTLAECNVLLKPYRLRVKRSRMFQGWAVAGLGVSGPYGLFRDKSHAVRWAFSLARGEVTPHYGTYTVQR
jgi:hypothetical protein